MMLSLGQFAFSLSTLAYQSLQRASAWRHAQNARMGARPATQYVGPGDDTIELNGVLLPEFMGSRNSLDTLRNMGHQGAAWPLVDGNGVVYGAWIIESVHENQTLFLRDGTPRRIEFSLSLRHVDDSRVASPGSVPIGSIDSGNAMAGVV